MANIDIYDSEFAGKYSSEREKFLNADKAIFETLEEVDLVDKVVVDIGCGDGRHAQKIYELGARKTIGVDNSESMIALTSEKETDAITFSVGEASNTGLEDEVADVVFSSFVIHYIEDLSPAFAEFNRLLKNGGKVVMTFNIFETTNPDLHNTGVPLKLADVVTVTNLVKTHEEVRSTLESNGFSIDSYEEMDSSYLSIAESYEHAGEITAVKNIICVASKIN